MRVDGRPVLASVALVAFAATNVTLDWLFIAQWGWGIKGAAWATALAEMAIGGDSGLDVDLSRVPVDDAVDSDHQRAFAETPSRFVVEVAGHDAEAFQAAI